MVLTDTEVVESDLVGEHALRHHLPDRLGLADELTVGASLEVAERVEPEGGLEGGLVGGAEVRQWVSSLQVDNSTSEAGPLFRPDWTAVAVAGGAPQPP